MTSYIPKPLVWEQSEFADLSQGTLVAYTIIGEIEVFGGRLNEWCKDYDSEEERWPVAIDHQLLSR